MGRPQPGARRPETGSQPRCGGRRDHHAAPTLVVTRTGSPPRTRSRARNNRPGTISLASERLTADAIRAHGGLRRGGLGRAAAALEVVLDDGLPARLEASGEQILERAAEQHAPQGSPSSPPIASTSRPNGSIAGPRRSAMASSNAPRHAAPPANRIRPERSDPVGMAVPLRRPPVFGDDPRHGGLRDAEDPRHLGGRLTSREDALGDLGALL